MNLKKIFFILLGCLSLGIGTAAVILPFLPSIPFLFLTAYAFGKSSERLQIWFLNTKLYRDNLEPFLKKQPMTKRAKFRMILTISFVMAIGAYFMGDRVLLQAMLGAIWFGHVLYFIFRIKTAS